MMSNEPPSVPTCARCGADASVAISSIVGTLVRSKVYCDPCWRVARLEAGQIMSEGPIRWGDSWDEVEAWLVRSLQGVESRSMRTSWRRLIAHDLRSQLAHLPAEVPDAVRVFLGEFGDAAGNVT